MTECSTQAHAKINLCLDITGIRPDGYHEVRMIMQELSLSDTVSIRREETPGIRLQCSDPGIPSDGRNLMVRAAERLAEFCGIGLSVSMRLEKKIPAAAGLGGGSSDAAAVILLLDRLYGLGLSVEEMQRIGLSVGADVPYFLIGGTALAEGIGEKLTELPPCPPCGILLVKPEEGASTREIYHAFDALREPLHPDVDQGIGALRNRNLTALALALGNSLERVTGGMLPVIGEIEDRMRGLGALGACMSGSGPTVFGLFGDLRTAENAGKKMKEYFPDCFTAAAEPVKSPFSHRHASMSCDQGF